MNISEKGVGYNTHYVHALSTGDETVSSGAAILRAVYINTALNNPLVIKEGATAIYTIPSGTPAGYRLPIANVRFTSIVSSPGGSATGNVTYEYEKMS